MEEAFDEMTKFVKYWVIFGDEYWSTDQNASQIEHSTWETERKLDENVRFDTISSKFRRLDSMWAESILM